MRLGFSFEGIFYNHLIVKGHIRASFERWLSPDNFDASGCQRQSLSELNTAS